MKILKPNKEHWRAILAEEVKYADSMIKKMKWLTPGTHTAAEIQAEIDAHIKGANQATSSITIEVDGVKIKIDKLKLFDAIYKTQKFAGLSVTKRPKWTIRPSRRPSPSATITFLKKREMRILSKFTDEYIYEKDRKFYLNIYYGLVSAGRHIIRNSKYECGDCALIQTEMEKNSKLPFEFYGIPSKSIRNLYGKCSVEVYYDKIGDPYGILITNADGFSVWSQDKISYKEIKRHYDLFRDMIEPSKSLVETIETIDEWGEWGILT